MITGRLPVLDQTDQGIRLLEEEKRRIARELNDGPAHSLTNISMKLSMIQGLMTSHPSRAQNELERTNSRLVEAINEIRRLIRELKPVAVDDVGLQVALQDLVSKMAVEWDIAIQYAADDDLSTITPAKQVAVYQLVKEVLCTMVRHTHVRALAMRLGRDGSHLLVELQETYSDHAWEADANASRIHRMKEHAEYLGGTLTVESQCASALKLKIRVPVFTLRG